MKKLSILLGSLVLVFGLAFTVKATADKVDICHYDGQSGNYQTLNIAQEAVSAHIPGHVNDYLGACAEASPTPSVSPSPSSSPCEYWCEDASPTPSPSPSPEVSPSPSSDPCVEEYNPAWVEDQPICPSPSPSPVPCEQTEEGCPSPTPEATPEAQLGGGGGSASAPTCSNGNTANVPAWPHVARSGERAVVNAFITEGDNAQIYWKVVGQSNWQYSSAQSNPDGVKPNADKWIDYTIHGLDPALGYTFGISQHSGCGGGDIVTAVIIDGPASRTFSVSYYELK
jgi:hypothetical protein